MTGSLDVVEERRQVEARALCMGSRQYREHPFELRHARRHLPDGEKGRRDVLEQHPRAFRSSVTAEQFRCDGDREGRKDIGVDGNLPPGTRGEVNGTCDLEDAPRPTGQADAGHPTVRQRRERFDAGDSAKPGRTAGCVNLIAAFHRLRGKVVSHAPASAGVANVLLIP